MYEFTSLGGEPKQEIVMLPDEGNKIVFTFEYKANQLAWFFGFEYNGEKYQNIRLTTSYNILRAYRSWLPFGLRCDTLDNEEPTDIEDFVTGYATVYMLTQEDMNAIESKYYQRS